MHFRFFCCEFLTILFFFQLGVGSQFNYGSLIDSVSVGGRKTYLGKGGVE